jgi:hypothetical protein
MTTKQIGGKGMREISERAVDEIIRRSKELIGMYKGQIKSCKERRRVCEKEAEEMSVRIGTKKMDIERLKIDIKALKNIHKDKSL